MPQLGVRLYLCESVLIACLQPLSFGIFVESVLMKQLGYSYRKVLTYLSNDAYTYLWKQICGNFCSSAKL